MNWLKGLLCPVCSASFLYTDAKNARFTLKGELDCPECGAHLEYPQHLQKVSLYLKMFAGVFVLLALFIWLIEDFPTLSMLIGVPSLLWYAYHIKKMMRLENGEKI